jgi:pimeloyl-ACP methyl ester carboxylesterase
VEVTQTGVRANGLTFGVLTCGDDGPLALCLHGFPDSAHSWDGLLPALAGAGFRAVAPWTRGYHPTEVPDDGDYSLDALVADANALHEVLGGDRDAVLVGHDWGAMTAYGAGIAEPQRWRRIVALAVPPPSIAAAAFLRYPQLKRSFYIFLFQTALAEALTGADDLDFVANLWGDWSPPFDHADALEHAKAALRDPTNLSAAIGYYRAMFATGGPSGSPAQPTLYMHGSADGAFGVEGVAGTETQLSADSRVEVIDGAGHFLHLERPDVVNPLVIDWLGRDIPAG